MINIEKLIRRAILEKDGKQVELAEKMEYTKNGFNNYLRKNRFYFHDIERMASILGYSVKLQFIDKETGKTIEGD